FFNNQVNPTTGSLSVRGEFANPKSEKGQRLMSPGMFVRIHLPLGEPHPALLVIDRAISSDPGLKYVYVLGEGNTIQYRGVTTGTLEDDGLRVIIPAVRDKDGKIIEGVDPSESVVVGALQQVRPRLQVNPERVPMPSFAAPTVARTPPVEKEKAKK